MPNIVHCRLDDRLIHGQVATAWLPHTRANLCLIANDRVAVDTTQQMLLEMAAPQGVALRFFTIEKTIAVIHKAAPEQKIFILIESAADAASLIKGGVPITALNIGNVRSSVGKTALTKTVYIDDADLTALRDITAQGVTIDYRLLPTDQALNLMDKIRG